MNGIQDLHPFGLQLIGKLTHGVLGLSHGQAVSGDDDHQFRLAEHQSRLFRAGLLDRAAAGGDRAAATGPIRNPDTGEHDVGQGAVHGLAHDVGEDDAPGAHQGAGDDEHVVVHREAGGAGRQARQGVEEGDHHRHVGPADGHDAGDSQHQRQTDQRQQQRQIVRHGDERAHHGQGGQQQQQVQPRQDAAADGAGGNQGLQLAEGHQAAHESDVADENSHAGGHQSAHQR